MTWQDPIVKETRKLRRQYAAKFNFDMDAIFEDIRNRQKKSGKKHVAFPSRRVKGMLKVAEQGHQTPTS